MSKRERVLARSPFYLMEKIMIKNPFFELPNNNPLRCHVFCFPGSPASPYYSLAHFAQIVRDICWTLKATGHTVFYYGYETCDVTTDEKIIVGDQNILEKAHPHLQKSYGHMDPSQDNEDIVKYLYERWAVDTEYEVLKQYKSGDFFFWILPAGGQRTLYNKLADLPVIHIEPSIGYIGGFLPYRIFQSNYIRAFHHGMYHINTFWQTTLDDDTKAQRPHGSHCMHTYTHWGSPPPYDDVIPIPFDISPFDFRVEKEDFLLCLARVVRGKGLEEAVKVSEHLSMKLIIAGPGDLEEVINRKIPQNVEVRGAVGLEERKELLSKASALLCLSELYETLGMAAIEAMLSGTVPIASNRGAFLETIESGYNGYLVDFRNTSEAADAIKNAHTIDPFNLRDAGLRYSREYLSPRYNAYLQNIYYSEKEMKPTFKNWNHGKEKINWPNGWMTPIDEKQVEETSTDIKEVKEDA